ncbi:MAG TPA: hypothetical protein VHG92_15055 [Afifellaceae bacterium]|nr:hypothetical protein [Afifellaceae bacterium]
MWIEAAPALFEEGRTATTTIPMMRKHLYTDGLALVAVAVSCIALALLTGHLDEPTLMHASANPALLLPSG